MSGREQSIAKQPFDKEIGMDMSESLVLLTKTGENEPEGIDETIGATYPITGPGERTVSEVWLQELMGPWPSLPGTASSSCSLHSDTEL